MEDNNFDATKAAWALGEIGPAAAPIVVDLAKIMRSNRGAVSREAARSLGKLGSVSKQAIPLLEEQIVMGDPTDDATWFAAQSVGLIGEPALGLLTVLRQQLDKSNSPMFNEHLQQAITALEEVEASQKEK